MPLLEVEDLRAGIDGKEILHGLSLSVPPGAVHAIMGPNGSGKSTLASVAMGHPRYAVTGGSIRFAGEDITRLAPEKRARKGLFLSFQYPAEIPGVQLDHFLFNAKKTITGNEKLSAKEFRAELDAALEELKLPKDFVARGLNEGFSGGEKKRSEMLALRILRPKLAVLDETDSGLDIDALKIVAESIRRAHERGTSILLITHYQRILSYLQPDMVHVLAHGRMAAAGGPELAHELEREGYARYAEKKEVA
jgi:Fe-S cluster assembly ATP-binding protein